LEIHAPHKPVHSLREMLTHLVLVTLGVLIALSFEGIGTWREHRALVREARANIVSEIRDNQRELANRLNNVEAEQKELDSILEALQTIIDRKKLNVSHVGTNMTTAELRDASHSTAQVTGAFALMEYDEVKKYAAVYSRQAMYQRLHDDTFQNLSRMLGLVTIFAAPEKASMREMEDLRTQVRITQAALLVEQQIGQALLREYENVLKEPGR
jgi:hypothetical protein